MTSGPNGLGEDTRDKGVEIVNEGEHQIRLFNLAASELHNITLPAGASRGLSFLFYLQNPTRLWKVIILAVRQNTEFSQKAVRLKKAANATSW